ncbi:MAG: ATP-binding cassette domain-containing protein [Agathobacter sp.]
MRKYLFLNKKTYLLYVVLMVLSAVLGTGFAFVISALLDCALEGEKKTLIYLLGFSCIYVIITVFIEYCNYIVKFRIIKNANVQLKKDLFSIEFNKPVARIKEKNSAYYCNELTTKCDMCSEMYFKNKLNVPFYVISLVVAILASIYIEPGMILIMLVLAVVTVIVMKRAAKPIEKTAIAFAKESPVYMQHLKDYFEGFKDIKIFNAESQVIEKHREYGDKLEQARFKNYRSMYFANSCGEMIGLLSTVLVTGFAALFAINGRISVGAVLAFAQLMGKIVGPISVFADIHTQYKSVGPVVKELKENLGNSKYREMVVEEDIFKGISLKNVNFSYGDVTVLKDISIEFENKKKYLIAGKSGCGKSTLLSLLLGTNNANHGSVHMLLANRTDEITIGNPYMSSLEQRPFIFEDTLKNNITMYKDYPDEAIQKVVRQCQLAEYVEKLPEGLETVISESGDSVSGGERLRIALARALLRNTQVMILDEFEANLDDGTAGEIERMLLNLTDKMVIAVTHKNDSIMLKKFDEIIVIKDGIIYGKGTYDEVKEWI